MKTQNLEQSLDVYCVQTESLVVSAKSGVASRPAPTIRLRRLQ